MKSLTKFFLFVLFTVSLSVHAGTPEVHVIPLKHRLAEEVVPVLRPLLAPGESVNSMDNRLIVRATPATLALIEKTLSKIDTARRNLRISVRHAGLNESTQDSHGISGRVQTGNTRIVVSDTHRDRGGVSVSGTGTNSALQVRTERHSTRSQANSTQNLTVIDGGRAFLRVGESIPDVQQFLVWVGNRPALVTGVQYRDVTTGFEVEPRIVGERILLTVSPRLAFRADHGVQTVHFEELRTQLTVQPGEWVDLGGIVGSAHELNRRILGSRQRSSSDTSGFLIRVDLQ